jgi:NADPH:quinone reductase-like Zn-dependent oxidoreductase
VLIKVHAAGLNPVDWKICEGYLRDFSPHRFPITLGLEFAGEVSSETVLTVHPCAASH